MRSRRCSSERGMDVARRTVVKYREAMGIGSSIQRRRQRKMVGAARSATRAQIGRWSLALRASALAWTPGGLDRQAVGRR